MDWDKLTEELLKRLDVIGAKLGQAGTYLWHLAVRQAYIDGAENLFGALMSAGLVIVSLWLLRKKAIPGFAAGERYRRDGQVCAILGCAVVGVLALGFFYGFAICAIDALGNPEFYALKHLLETVK